MYVKHNCEPNLSVLSLNKFMQSGPKRKITALGGTTFAPNVMLCLKKSFREGLNNGEACLDANISEKTFYLVLEKNEKLKIYFKLLQKNVTKIAKQNIFKKIKAGDTEQSKWWVERRDKDFKNKTDITSDNKPLPLLAGKSNGDKGNTSDRKITETSEED